MATSFTPPKPNPLPIKGADTLFNTTGSPTPPPQGQIPRVRPNCLEIYPSHASLEFSVGDLQHLGKVTHIGNLVFEVTIADPPAAELLEFTIEITSPERKVLHKARLCPGSGIKPGAHSRYLFSFNDDEARHANQYFIQGNRLIVRAEAAEEIYEGRIQVAMNECR